MTAIEHRLLPLQVNRFEFRAVGSSQSVSGPLVAMNTMLADSLNWIADKLKVELDAGKNLADGVLSVLKEIMSLHGNVIFGGDGYSPEWHKMAVEERGLKNIPTTADALLALREESVIDLFKNTGVLSPRGTGKAGLKYIQSNISFR